MKKKIILLTIMFIMLFNLAVPPKKTEAVIVPIARIVLGSTAERLILGMAQRAGVKFASRKSQKDLINWINKEAIHNNNPKAINLIKQANEKAPSYKKPGWKKYVLDPILWLTGIDIILTGIDLLMGGEEDVFDENGNNVTYVNGISCQANKKRETSRFYTWMIMYDGKNVDTWPDYPASNDPSKASCAITNVLFDNKPPYSVLVRATVSGSDVFDSFGPSSPDKMERTFYLTKEQVERDVTNYGLGKQSADFSTHVTKNTNNYITNILNNPNYTLPKFVEINIPDNSTDNDYLIDWVNPPVTSQFDDQTDNNGDWEPVDDTELPPRDTDIDKPPASSWWEMLIKPIIELIGKIVDGITDIAKALIGLVDKLIDAIISLIIPSEGFFDGFFDDLNSLFDSKIPVFGQLKDFFTSIEDVSVGTTAPRFEVSLPEQYGGVEVSIIDLSMFDEYRAYILNFIRFIAWFIFLKKLFNRLPKIIY